MRIAVHVREPEVEDDELGARRLGQHDRLGAGGGRDDLEALPFEVGADEIPDLPFVLDHEDRRRHGVARSLPGTR
jgi:hypothetical protein